MIKDKGNARESQLDTWMKKTTDYLEEFVITDAILSLTEKTKRQGE